MREGVDIVGLKFDYWNFSGWWMLKFGAFSSGFSGAWMLELGAFSSCHKSRRHRLLVASRNADAGGGMPSLLKGVNCRDALPGGGSHAPITERAFWREARPWPRARPGRREREFDF